VHDPKPEENAAVRAGIIRTSLLLAFLCPPPVLAQEFDLRTFEYHPAVLDGRPPALAFGRDRNDDRWERLGTLLENSTVAGLWVATTLGTIGIMNRPTIFGDGRCERGNPILGDYGCGPSTTLHGIVAASSVMLFTGSEVLNLTTGRRSDRSQTEKVLLWITRAGMFTLPLIGIISRFPDTIGINDAENQREFGRVMRTIHAGAGYVTVVAYTITFMLD
jgi:hypothetical protein